MTEFGYGRIRDLGGMPDLLREMAGQKGLGRVFHDQDMSISILETPDAVVPMRDLICLYDNAARITSARSFGLVASSGLTAEDYGLACLYAIQAPNLLTALKRFQTALPYHESGSSLRLAADGDELRVGYHNIYQNLAGWRHSGDFTLCGLSTLIGAYLDEGWQPLRIDTCYAKGRWAQDHECLFDAPVTFGRDDISVVLNREVVHHSNGTRRIEPGQMLSVADVRRTGDELPRDLPSMVVNVVERRLLEQDVDIEGTAAVLGLGPRTLQRRLSGDGLNYRDLVLHCRMRRARELLAEPEAAIHQIAHEVGYSSTPQFYRAFKTYIGTTPEGYRAGLSRPGPLSDARA
ncbi:MAG: AraC family transcriptional regulator ligand-binding domain-containing protein [Anderseniella sp.]